MSHPTTHECPGGCGRPVPRHRLACRTCWYRLPFGLRVAVTGCRVGSREHLDAVADASRWYRENDRGPA